MRKALVLGGGGSYGIAWESGLLVGLAEAGMDVREADFIVGTSAGSQVGTVVASGVDWEEIWAHQVDPPLKDRYVPSLIDMPALFRLYARIRSEAGSPKEWLLGLGTLSRQTVTVSEADRLEEIEQRLQLPQPSKWPERLGIVGVDTLSGERSMWTGRSGVDLIRAIAASSAVPGVYPAVTIGERRYLDGGVYSMENADQAEGYGKVLVLCVGLPIATPYTLDRQIEHLRRSGSDVEVIQPDQSVLSVLRQAGGNALNPEVRTPVAEAAKAQGLSLSRKLAAFW